MTIQAGDDSNDKPIREVYLNDRDQRAILLQGGGRPAEIVLPFAWGAPLLMTSLKGLMHLAVTPIVPSAVSFAG